ncbi:hypothetical protein CLF_105064 [Clonorchis sinensis]|uniref:Uncharacterized protein n=1 Tax=Clonorchis sinensis TaxID=79923 RepID=G7YCX1_CLOSI|nr:hypothetical protein CLF_105064 [Clonorchis sinensis]
MSKRPQQHQTTTIRHTDPSNSGEQSDNHSTEDLERKKNIAEMLRLDAIKIIIIQLTTLSCHQKEARGLRYRQVTQGYTKAIEMPRMGSNKGPSAWETAMTDTIVYADNGFHTSFLKSLFDFPYLVSTLHVVVRKETFEEVGRLACCPESCRTITSLGRMFHVQATDQTNACPDLSESQPIWIEHLSSTLLARFSITDPVALCRIRLSHIRLVFGCAGFLVDVRAVHPIDGSKTRGMEDSNNVLGEDPHNVSKWGVNRLQVHARYCRAYGIARQQLSLTTRIDTQFYTSRTRPPALRVKNMLGRLVRAYDQISQSEPRHCEGGRRRTVLPFLNYV